MLNKKQIAFFIVSVIFSINALKAQKMTAYITIDPDGYTNIREQPNASSKILGKAYKYEVLLYIGYDYCGSNMFTTGNWEPVEGNYATGYMFNRHMLNISNLPLLPLKRTIDMNEAGTVIFANDTLSLVMQVQTIEEWNDDNSRFYGAIHSPEQLKYMKDNDIFDTEISEMYILNIRTGVKTILPHDKIKKYYNPIIARVHIGRDGELYIYIAGGEEGEQYGVWISIANGDIIYQSIEWWPC